MAPSLATMMGIFLSTESEVHVGGSAVPPPPSRGGYARLLYGLFHYLCIYHHQLTHETLAQYWLNVEPTSQTVAQHLVNIGSTLWCLLSSCYDVHVAGLPRMDVLHYWLPGRSHYLSVHPDISRRVITNTL